MAVVLKANSFPKIVLYSYLLYIWLLKCDDKVLVKINHLEMFQSISETITINSNKLEYNNSIEKT